MHIDPTAAKLARWMAILGAVCGVIYAFGGLVVDLLTVSVNWGTAMAFGALIGMPVIFGAVGLLCGALIALIGRGLGVARDRERSR